MPDKTKTFICLVCKREYKFNDHHRCLDNNFERLEYKKQTPDYEYKREYMREYMKRRRNKHKLTHYE